MHIWELLLGESKSPFPVLFRALVEGGRTPAVPESHPRQGLRYLMGFCIAGMAAIIFFFSQL